jgi:hypothetical protein
MQAGGTQCRTLSRTIKREPPIPDIPGKWVHRDLFPYGRKSFGLFRCSKCGNAWSSAHARKDYRQACKKCDEYMHAWGFWLNDDKSRRHQDSLRTAVKLSEPHDKTRCEACMKGVCSTEKELVQHIIDYFKIDET